MIYPIITTIRLITAIREHTGNNSVINCTWNVTDAEQIVTDNDEKNADSNENKDQGRGRYAK